jgi:hypothetical protein
MHKPAFLLSVATLLCMSALSGCSVSTHENGKKDDVDVRTPFGSVSVHAGQTDIKDTGLALYPGARVKQDSDDKHDEAKVNVSSSFFGAKVVVLKFESDDSPDKVLAFYRKDMGKYGKVVDCTGDFNLNFHAHRDKDAPVSCDGHDSGHEYKEELKVGTENNQRVCAVKPRGNGSEFVLVYARAWEGQGTM